MLNVLCNAGGLQSLLIFFVASPCVTNLFQAQERHTCGRGLLCITLEEGQKSLFWPCREDGWGKDHMGVPDGLHQYSITMKRHHAHDTSYKGKHFIGLVYSFSSLSWQEAWWHNKQTWYWDELRVLYLDLDPYVATKDKQWPVLKHFEHQSPAPVSHFPQQDDTFFNKVTPTNLFQIAPLANDQP